MDATLKEVLELMKLKGPINYVIWSYYVEMILMQEGLWKFIDSTRRSNKSKAASSKRPRLQSGCTLTTWEKKKMRLNWAR